MMKEEPIKIIELDTDKKVTKIKGSAADIRLTICMEKTKEKLNKLIIDSNRVITK